MISTKLLRIKKFFKKPNGDNVVDLTSSTFSFEKDSGISAAFTIVQQEEAMRPDLIAVRLYDDQSYYEALLKYNGISNPFSVNQNDFLLAPSFRNLDEMLTPPKTIIDKGAQQKTSNENLLLNPKSNKDKKRLDALRDKVKEIVPPNVNTEGNKNVKVRDGKVIFGEDVTQVNKDNCPIPISRARLIQQLTKANLF